MQSAKDGNSGLEGGSGEGWITGLDDPSGWVERKTARLIPHTVGCIILECKYTLIHSITLAKRKSNLSRVPDIIT
jgi:hypothetical protein